MSASLQVGDDGECLHVVSCHAPTFIASQEEKDEFYRYLQDVLQTVPQRENFVLLGDFNARIGSRSHASSDG